MPLDRLLARLSRNAMQSRSCSPEYLSITLSPSQLLTAPSSNRKLIVLDLNGTLVYRPKKQAGRTNTTPEGHRRRPAHPRPYLLSFLAYLAHAETRLWLDSMIWSSAQPHSVTCMIEKCFSDSTKHFLAVWNRKHFELKGDQYHKKSQTIKDLELVFKVFPEHSVMSTLLLDDSIRKAQMQPFNHLCIPDYNHERRALDRQIQQGTADGPYDEILLAVIGILEAAKSQSNVAAWIRAGHLNDSNVTSGAEELPWFSGKETVARWALRGRATLEAFGLEAVAFP